MHASNFIKQHAETVTVRNYHNADCTLRKKSLCYLWQFSAHFRSLLWVALCAYFYLEIPSWARYTVQSKQNWNDNNHNRKVSRQCTDRYFQRKQGTVLNITGSYKYIQLIQQLVRSLGIRVKKHTNYKNKRKIMNTHIAGKRAGCKRPGNVTKGRLGSG